jgi:hypothetical protein
MIYTLRGMNWRREIAPTASHIRGVLCLDNLSCVGSKPRSVFHCSDKEPV